MRGPPAREKTGWNDVRYLHAGLALSLGIALVAQLVLVVQVSQTRANVQALLELGNRTHRTSFLTGQLAQDLHRHTELTVDALKEPPGALTRSLRRLERSDAAIAQHLAALQEGLSPVDRGEWSALAPRVAAVRRRSSRILAELGAGDAAGAADLLRDLEAQNAAVRADLDRFAQRSEVEAGQLLGAAERRLGRVWALESSLTVGLVLAFGLVWVGVSWALRRRARSIEDYVERLEVANRDLDAFAGRVAHELRAVLAPLPSVAALLDASGSAATAGRAAAVVGRVAGASQELIDGLLDFSRVAREPAETSASVTEALEAARSSVAAAATAADVEISLEVAASEDLRVRCSRALLQVVLVNLLGNAVKFLSGWPERRVRCSTRAEGGYVAISVTDTGPGVPPEALARLFEPFYRAPGTTASGSGIGLSTVRRIAERYGGRVEATSTVGHGTTMVVWLPRVS